MSTAGRPFLLLLCVGAVGNLATAQPPSSIITIDSARRLATGASGVYVSGVVTAAFGTRLRYIQDGTGAIALWGSNTTILDTVQVGDSIIVGDTITEFNGLLQINVRYVERVASGCVPVPYPRCLSLRDTDFAERWESWLVRLDSVYLIDTAAQPADTFKANYTGYRLTDGTDTQWLWIETTSNLPGKLKPHPTRAITITGVIKEYRGVYELVPRSYSDIDTLATPCFSTPLPVNIGTARNLPDHYRITTSGTVTAVFGTRLAFMQDTTGAISIYSPCSLLAGLSEGDSIQLTGTLTTYAQLKQIEPQALRKLAQGTPPPPRPITLSDTDFSEINESWLVQVDSAFILSDTTHFTTTGQPRFYLTLGTDTQILWIRSETDIPGKPVVYTSPVRVTGILIEYNSVYELVPRRYTDIDTLASDTTGNDTTGGNPPPTAILLPQTHTPEALYGTIYTLTGKPVLSGQLPTLLTHTGHLPQGIYILKLTDQEHAPQRRHLILITH